MKNASLWDAEFKSGRLGFLRRPSELRRFVEIGAMVARAAQQNGPVEVVDIGSGEGLLLSQLRTQSVQRYIALDISGVALKAIRDGLVPVARVRSSLAAWDGRPEPVAPRILVASEMLYYDPGGVMQLRKLAARWPRTIEVVVSCVAGRADKPNWAAASTALWRDMRATGWRRLELVQVADKQAELAWDIARYIV